MKVVIVDRNQDDLDKLGEYLVNYKSNNVVIFKYNNPLEFQKYILKGYSFDIIYLDEHALPLSIMILIQHLLPEAHLIILTENKNFIYYSFDDLLLKPINKNILYHNLSMIKQILSLKSIKLLCYKNKREIYLNSNDIYYLESYYGHVYVHSKNDTYLARMRHLHQYDYVLYKLGFLLIHKSIILNINKIKEANVNEYILDNGKILYPSVRRKYQAFKLYQQYIMNYSKHRIVK